MLIAVFLGIFGWWMAVLTIFNFYREANKRPDGKIPALRLVYLQKRKKFRVAAQEGEGSSVAQALRDLWNEILKGA